MMTQPDQRECTSCTVPTDHPSALCQFCRNYDGPPIDDPLAAGANTAPTNPALNTRLLDNAANFARCAAEDVSDQLAALPADSSMWVSVDLVRAQRHLRAAIRLIEQTAAKIDTEVVAR